MKYFKIINGHLTYYINPDKIDAITETSKHINLIFNGQQIQIPKTILTIDQLILFNENTETDKNSDSFVKINYLNYTFPLKSIFWFSINKANETFQVVSQTLNINVNSENDGYKCFADFLKSLYFINIYPI
jgi:hypothetical protein